MAKLGEASAVGSRKEFADQPSVVLEEPFALLSGADDASRDDWQIGRAGVPETPLELLAEAVRPVQAARLVAVEKDVVESEGVVSPRRNPKGLADAPDVGGEMGSEGVAVELVNLKPPARRRGGAVAASVAALIAVDRTAGGTCENVITPEQTVPKDPIAVPWESCITIGKYWGYHFDDE